MILFVFTSTMLMVIMKYNLTNNISNFKHKDNIGSAPNHLLNKKQYYKESDEIVIVQFYKEFSFFLVSILEKLKK